MSDIPISEQIEVATRTAELREYLAFKFKDTHQATLVGGPETLAELERAGQVMRAVVETLRGAVK